MTDFSPFTNITISAPTGTSQHGRPNFLCFPAKWSTVLSFFIANYLTHAFTLWKKPGEKSSEYVFAAILALLFPISGISRGLDAINRHASWQASGNFVPGLLGFGNKDFEKRAAAKAGAFAILVREHSDRFTLENSSSISHFEYNGDNWHQATLKGKLPDQATSRSYVMPAPTYRIVMDAEEGDNPTCIRTTCNISGLLWLHASSSYIVMNLPGCHAESIKLERSFDSVPDSEPEFALAQSSSIPQILLAFLQIIYASYTLARNTGDEIERYGYVSFSLTVIPYIIMSFINLLGNLATPTYPCVYLVATSTMHEAKNRGNIVSGYIGYIEDKDLKTIAGAEDFQILRADCSTADHSNSHRIVRDPPAPQRAESNRQVSISVCFDKKCPYKEFHGSIRVASGKPRALRTTDSHYSELIVYSMGLACTTVAPIVILVYVSKRYPTSRPLQERLPVLLWYAMGDLLGILLFYYREQANISNILGELKVMFLMLSDICHDNRRDQKSGYKKRKEYMSGRWLKLILLAFGCTVGLGLASWNFYHVAVELLAFGDCRLMTE